MRLNQAQLRLLNAVEKPAAADPLLARMDKLEKILKDFKVDIPETDAFDDSNIVSRLDRVEKVLEKLVLTKPTAYEFTVTRNATGGLEKIVATPKDGGR